MPLYHACLLCSISARTPASTAALDPQHTRSSLPAPTPAAHARVRVRVAACRQPRGSTSLPPATTHLARAALHRPALASHLLAAVGVLLLFHNRRTASSHPPPACLYTRPAIRRAQARGCSHGRQRCRASSDLRPDGERAFEAQPHARLSCVRRQLRSSPMRHDPGSAASDKEQQAEDLLVLFSPPRPLVRVPRCTQDGRFVLVRIQLQQRLGAAGWRRARRSPRALLRQDFPSEEARARFKHSCAQTVAANCRDGARCAAAGAPPDGALALAAAHACVRLHLFRASCSLQAIDACRGPAWLRWLGWRPSECHTTRSDGCFLHIEPGRMHAARWRVFGGVRPPVAQLAPCSVMKHTHTDKRIGEICARCGARR